MSRIAIPIAFYLFAQKPRATPTFQGIPVACTFLANQALPIFENAFSGLELSIIYKTGAKGHTYEEIGGIFGFYPSSCRVGLPVYEKLDTLEEARLGANGIAKSPVGHLVMYGDCKYGCAVVTLSKMCLYKCKDDEPDLSSPIWTWTRNSDK